MVSIIFYQHANLSCTGGAREENNTINYNTCHVAKFLFPADEYSGTVKDSGKSQSVLFQILQ